MRLIIIIAYLVFIYFMLGGFKAEAKTQQEIIRQISSAASVVGVDPDIAVAIATVESSLNPKAVGALNEQGLFQLRPEYHTTIVGNPGHNILIGVAYLAELKTKYQYKYGDAWFVLFNYGPAKAPKRPRETQYYKRVMAELSRIRVKRFIAVR